MAFLLTEARIALRGARNGHTTTVAADKYLIPQEKLAPRNLGAIFMILSIKNIHRRVTLVR